MRLWSDEAFDAILTIFDDRKLLGGNGMITGPSPPSGQSLSTWTKVMNLDRLDIT